MKLEPGEYTITRDDIFIDEAGNVQLKPGAQPKKTQAPDLRDSDGRYLYRFSQGSYEDRYVFFCAHQKAMSQKEAYQAVLAALKTLPDEIEHDFDAKDLFALAFEAAGFVDVEARLRAGVHAPNSRFYDERKYLEGCLDQHPCMNQ